MRSSSAAQPGGLGLSMLSGSLNGPGGDSRLAHSVVPQCGLPKEARQPPPDYYSHPGSQSLQSVMTTKSENNAFLTRRSLLPL
jgi:hypothetical protein